MKRTSMKKQTMNRILKHDGEFIDRLFIKLESPSIKNLFDVLVNSDEIMDDVTEPVSPTTKKDPTLR